MDKHVGKAEVAHGVLVNALVEVQGIVAEIGSQTVIPVQHAGDAVEAESVQMVLLHPVFAVRQQEVFHLVFAVVEAPCAPGGVMARIAFVEVERFVSVQLAEPLGLVAHGVRMHYVHDDRDAGGVGLVHQAFELLGRAEAGAQGKETRHLIAEGSVVRMLLKGHNLQGVVTQALYPWKHVGAELVEGRYPFLLSAHAYVALVDERMRALAGSAVLPLIWNGIPDLGAEHLGLRVLHHASGVRGYALASSAGPLDPEFVQAAVAEEQLSEPELPIAGAYGLKGVIGSAFPVVEVADQVYSAGVGGPFAYHPAVFGVMQAVVEMIVCGIAQGAVAGKLALLGEYALVAGLYGFGVRLQPGVGLIYLFHLPRFSTFSRDVRRYSRHPLMSSSERAMYLSMSARPVCGSSTFAAMASSSSMAAEKSNFCI